MAVAATMVVVVNQIRVGSDTKKNCKEGATVEPFGSFVSNLYSRWGDLDISIELPSGSLVSPTGKKRKQRLLRDILRALQRRGSVNAYERDTGVRNIRLKIVKNTHYNTLVINHYNRIPSSGVEWTLESTCPLRINCSDGVVRSTQFIPHARVPLLIFESNYQSISCDISISNLVGQVKSKFLLWITQIDERFRDMVLLVKEWAKSQDINSPKTGTLNSYSLSLLVIFHFQTCEPAILPPLQELYAGNIAHDLTGVRVTAERQIQDICLTNIARFRTNKMGNINRSTLSELFISFFNKIGDPFEQAENAARAVGKKELIMISEAFNETSCMLLGNQEQSFLVTSLVRPQIRSQFSPNKGNSTFRSGGFGHRADVSSTTRPVRGQYQGMPLDSYSSPVYSQRQQFRSPVHPIENRFQNWQSTLHPSPVVSSQRHLSYSTVRPIQNHYENRQMESPSLPNVYLPRQGQAVHGQGQQVWRPRHSER
ncbi:hypothetical protein IFM89_026509 [Coptis chinensis]|uniref:Uncharacterized protein n=1 Tax=Coptis chinensis TaxID=261450 RepID=A0A835LNP7_9MAGN|nr:hypothetical protein IFM89_026509 [Coptis chinensis]